MPSGWIARPSCTGSSCTIQLTGGPGFYYDGTVANSCCAGGTLNDGNPANNWGSGAAQCGAPLALSFDMTVQNSTLANVSLPLQLRGTSDGTTGCWAAADNILSLINFQMNSASCNTPYLPTLCNPSGNASFPANLSGAAYQWQMSTDSVNFNNISDNTNYAGTNTASLSLSNIPSSWYGYQYRCVVDGTNGHLYTLKFVNTWTGTIDRNWNNPGNWSCGAVPDAYTDAIINSGTVHVTANCSVRSVTTATGVSFTVDPGVVFTVVH